MFAIPPPPKYPLVPGVANPNVVPGMPMPLLESNNTLKQPTGPEYQFVSGEGTYMLRDEWQLHTPPPHPTEGPVLNPNPLSTSILPPGAGTKLSIVVTSGKGDAPRQYRDSIDEKPDFSNFTLEHAEKEARKSHETNSSGTGSYTQSNSTGSKPPAFGAENNLLTPHQTAKDASKKKKPKSSLTKSNSSFISRVSPHENMSKRLAERDADGLLAFANINRAVQWLDLTTDNNYRGDHLVKIFFTKAHMLCHDANMVTMSPNHIDVIIGSNSADIIWYEPFSQRYNRINKNGMINKSPVSEIKWIPGSENLFLASHMDGSLIVYDKDREDAAFVREETNQPYGEHNGIVGGIADAGSSAANGSDRDSTYLRIDKSVNSKNQKMNPVSSWKLSHQRINSFAFSPDCRHLAVVSEDGTLKVIDYLKEKLLDIYTSYFGGLTCLCWSPDGQYIVTGGQDDLLTIWSLQDRRIVARCPGHQAFVSAVAFDPWRCDDQNYRFGSVGNDCRLLLWDFNVSMLHRPKGAIGRSTIPPLSRQQTEKEAVSRLRSNSSLTTSSAEVKDSIEHPVESRKLTAELPPVMSKVLDAEPLSWLEFREDCIITTCIMGHIRTWARPQEATNESQTTLSASSNA